MSQTPAAYRERLLPRWWAWLAAAILGVMLAVAYGYALGATVGWLVLALSLVLVVALVLVTAPRIEVVEDALHVGSATLPAGAIASVETVTAADIARLRGPGADARVFTALRPWSCSDGVLVTLDDPADPHPAWLFSSRHPSRVVQALTATMGR